MNTCKTCKRWDQFGGSDNQLGTCNSAFLIADVDEKVEMTPPPRGLMARGDGGDSVVLMVHADFGCIHHSAPELTHVTIEEHD